ncbi:lamin tail domain-containing protein [Halegenticoccus soli]|uniref:lamin tail domain-containing protein n=1 Tax=Halegenticoccus soli TaxID=1985678 RepID=UPI0013042DF3|nr:lamin tail domain-containing protein [Halegenticoccus soli]
MIGAGAALSLAGFGAGSTVVASDHSGLAFAEVNTKDEYVVLKNPAESDFDLTGYAIDFEANGENEQDRPFPDGTVIGAGETLTVATGYKDVDADVDFDSDGGLIRDDGSDVIAILDPDGEEILRSDDESHWADDSNEGEEQDESGPEEYDITITVVDRDGKPLQGKITLLGTEAEILGERELDEDGQASWVVREQGRYAYNIYEVDGYEPSSDDSSFEVDGDTELTVEMTEVDESDDEEQDGSSERDDDGEQNEEESDDGPEEENAADEDC